MRTTAVIVALSCLLHCPAALGMEKGSAAPVWEEGPLDGFRSSLWEDTSLFSLRSRVRLDCLLHASLRDEPEFRIGGVALTADLGIASSFGIGLRVRGTGRMENQSGFERFDLYMDNATLKLAIDISPATGIQMRLFLTGRLPTGFPLTSYGGRAGILLSGGIPSHPFFLGLSLGCYDTEESLKFTAQITQASLMSFHHHL